MGCCNCDSINNPRVCWLVINATRKAGTYMDIFPSTLFIRDAWFYDFELSRTKSDWSALCIMHADVDRGLVFWRVCDHRGLGEWRKRQMISNDKFHSGQGFHANLHKVVILEQSLKIALINISTEEQPRKLCWFWNKLIFIAVFFRNCIRGAPFTNME